MANYFSIPELTSDLKDSDFQLTVNMQCFIRELFINGEKAAENLTFKSSPTVLNIRVDLLSRNGKNLIAMRIRDVQYTGGVCKNTIRLTHPSFGTAESLMIKPLAKDNLYGSGEKINLAIDYVSGMRTGSKIKLTVISDFNQLIETRFKTPEQLKESNMVMLNRDLYKPGFYHVIATTDGPFYVQHDVWIAVEPEKIDCPEDPPMADMKDWWEKALSELKTIPPETKITKLSDAGNESKDVFEVVFKSLENVTIYGYLFIPKKDGKFPAILYVPGYTQSYNKNSFIKNPEDVVEFGVCIRGHGRSTEEINPGFGLYGCVSYNICDPEKYFYRGAYMDCMRAFEILSSLPKVDKERIGVLGMSQGGGLSLVTAALAGNRVKACVAIAPFLGDLAHHGSVRPVFEDEKLFFAKRYNCTVESINKTLNFVDTKYMTQWITASVLMMNGLFDDDCPPHVGFAAYNNIRSTKKYMLYPDDGHLIFKAIPVGRNFLRAELGF